MRERILQIHTLLDSESPVQLGFLVYRSPWELLIAVILSAQTTDRQVNGVTDELFTRYPDPQALADADPTDVERIIRSTGYFRAKAARIIAAARRVRDAFSGTVPDDMDRLLSIPGVGRKSANVILGAVFGKPAVIVDTHFSRVVRRLGLSRARQPETIERDISTLLPEDMQYRFSMTVNYHGRMVCTARSPRCEDCQLCSLCPRIGVEG